MRTLVFWNYANYRRVLCTPDYFWIVDDAPGTCCQFPKPRLLDSNWQLSGDAAESEIDRSPVI
jgi:hypothetical protein